jgi:hypothetical protein
VSLESGAEVFLGYIVRGKQFSGIKNNGLGSSVALGALGERDHLGRISGVS